MSETLISTYRCNLCNRDFKKYNKKDESQIFGLNESRSSTYNFVLKFEKPNVAGLNKHICTYCISDILNKFGE